MTDGYNLKTIRTLLVEGFTDDELRRLCFDIPEFRPVYDELARNTGKAQIVDHLIEHAERKRLLEILLDYAKQANPATYRQYESYYIPAQPKDQLVASESRGQCINILFLAANPLNTTRLRLDEEIREIDQAIHQAEFGDIFSIHQQWAVRVADLQGYLLRHRPEIVHFSGHGSEHGEIVLESVSGNCHPVSPRALSQLFSILKDNVRCVVLNACYSERQARAIAEQIDCVIGMSKAIGDAAAISFAKAFYQALGYGHDVRTAFDLGCVQIDLENLSEQDTPKLLALKSDPKDIVFVHL